MTRECCVFQLWVTDMLSIIQIEKFSKDSKDSLLSVWKPFLEHFARTKLDPDL